MGWGGHGFLTFCNICLIFIAAALGHPARAEISLPPARACFDQGQYPHCGLYAMSSYLEIRGNSLQGKEAAPLPGVNPAFLAAAYNAEVGSGSDGTDTIWLLYAMKKHGAVPMEASRAAKGKPGLPVAWNDGHQALLDESELRQLLRAAYRHESCDDTFTGKRYLAEVLGFDPRSFAIAMVTEHEPEREAEDDDEPPAQFRHGDEEASTEVLDARMRRNGLDPAPRYLAAALLHSIIVEELYHGYPVFLTLNPSKVQGDFGRFAVIDDSDLVPWGTAEENSHAMVAVGHCDRHDTTDPLCGRFAFQMRRRNIADCVVLQNSWGHDSHLNGYVCISPPALRRLVHSALVPRTRLVGTRGKNKQCGRLLAGS